MEEKGMFDRPAEPHELVPDDYFAAIDPDSYYPSDQPLEVDLGCGDGRFVLKMAAHYPERNFLAVERLLGRVRKVCRGAKRGDLENLRVLRLESLYTLEWLLPEASLDRVHLLCPDPWPKAKHHRRRLFQRPFLDAVVRVLKPGGELLFKTDHTGYFEWSEEHLEGYEGLQRVDWPEDAFFYPKTDFQIQWEAQGKVLHRLRAVKPG